MSGLSVLLRTVGSSILVLSGLSTLQFQTGTTVTDHGLVSVRS